MRKPVTAAVLAGLVGALIAVPVVVYASHSFNDVPDTHTFHNDIAWLADAEVTKGCNPPANDQFCPDDFVTRAQMAAFMRRIAQYLDAEDGTPAQADHAVTADSATNATSANSATEADNADTVDGSHAADLRTTVDGLNHNTGPTFLNPTSVPSDTPTTVLEKTLSSADGAFALIDYGFWFRSTGGTVNAWIQIDEPVCDSEPSTVTPGTLRAQFVPSSVQGLSATLSGSVVLPTAGNPTVTLCAFAGSATASVGDAHLNTIQTDSGSATLLSAKQ